MLCKLKGEDMEQEVLKPKIGTEEIRKAEEILRKYKTGKAQLERQVLLR